MPRKIKFLNALLCEHVVMGANKKHTLINVYSGNIIVGQLPANLTFGLYVEMAAGSPPEMDVELRMDGKPFGKIVAQFPGNHMEQQSNLVVPLIQVGIDKDLTFSVVATADGYANTTLIKKRISIGEVPT